MPRRIFTGFALFLVVSISCRGPSKRAPERHTASGQAASGEAGFGSGSMSRDATVLSRITGRLQAAESLPISVEDTAALRDALRSADDALQRLPQGADRAGRAGAVRAALLEQLENYAATRPDSGWTPAIHGELARQYREQGRFTKAMEHWAEAWAKTAQFDTPAEREISDRALVETAFLYTGLGRVDDLARVIAEHRGRVMVQPGVAQQWARVTEAYVEMANNPGKAYRCGTFALDNVSRALTGRSFSGLWTVPSSPNGFTLDELSRLSEEHRLDLVPAFRSEGAPFIVPSVVHWKQNHYASIESEAQGRFRVKDPTFRSEVWMDQTALEEESSGYFLVPRAFGLPAGWRLATPAESAQVYGKGYPNTHDDNAPPGCADECCDSGPGPSGTGSSQDPCGMATWEVQEPQINLIVTDIPMRYDSAIGPDFVLNLKWRQRYTQPSFGGFSNFGPGWNSDLLSYLSLSEWNTGFGPSEMELVLGDGINYTFSFDNGSQVSNQHRMGGMWAVRALDASQTSVVYVDLFTEMAPRIGL